MWRCPVNPGLPPHISIQDGLTKLSEKIRENDSSSIDTERPPLSLKLATDQERGHQRFLSLQRILSTIDLETYAKERPPPPKPQCSKPSNNLYEELVGENNDDFYKAAKTLNNPETVGHTSSGSAMQEMKSLNVQNGSRPGPSSE